MSNDIPTLELGGAPTPAVATPETLPAATADIVPAPAQAESTLTMESLSVEERKVVEDFIEKIDITDSNVVMQYGAPAQNKIAQFSDSILQNTKTKDMGVIGKDLTNLVVEIKSFGEEDKGGFLGLFGGNKIKKSVNKMMANYSNVETNIDKIVTTLETHQRTLMKDIAMLDAMYQNNHSYFKELSMYIIAGMERLRQYQETDIPAQRAIAERSADEMEAQKLNDMISLAGRFDKKLHDLKLSRTISIQMAPQIRMMQNNDAQLVEKIQSSIVNAIPLWKNQMVLSLGLSNARTALEAQRKVTDMTNELLVKNSEMLRLGSVEVAKESERSIVSIETVRKTNENLIATITEVLEIQQKGTQERAAAEQELNKIEGDLKLALMESSKRAAQIPQSNNQ